MKVQPPGEPILVGDWLPDDDFGVFPVGSKPKRRLTCPPSERRPFLIPGHSYLFKIADDWKAQQLWSEVLAYQIGCLVGIDVPPAFFARDEKTGQTGVLVEFFYGFPDDPAPPRLVHGIDLIRRVVGPSASDRPHAIRANVALCRGMGIPDAADWWGKVLTFDALIGNTDRHTENWGFLVSLQRGARPKIGMAPVYDNGTSLGFQHNLADLERPGFLERFIDKGRHHCGWAIAGDRPTPHMELCERFAVQFPGTGVAMKNVIRLADQQISDLIRRNVCVDVGVPFSADRAEFVTQLVMARRDRLARALGG